MYKWREWPKKRLYLWASESERWNCDSVTMAQPKYGPSFSTHKHFSNSNHSRRTTRKGGINLNRVWSPNNIRSPDCEYMVSITWILGLQSPQCMFWQIYADTYFLWAKKEKTKNTPFGKSSVQLKGGALIDTEVIKVHYMDGQGREGPVWCTLNSHITTLNFHITIHNLQFTALNSQLLIHNSHITTDNSQLTIHNSQFSTPRTCYTFRCHI